MKNLSARRQVQQPDEYMNKLTVLFQGLAFLLFFMQNTFTDLFRNNLQSLCTHYLTKLIKILLFKFAQLQSPHTRVLCLSDLSCI